MKIVNDLLDSMEVRRRREDRQAAMFFGAGCLIFIILGVIVVVVTTVLNAVETANVNNLYGETYASACQPVPAGQDSADNLPDAPSPRGLLLLISDTQRRHEWQSQLPSQWRAENADEVVLIGCIEEERVLLETCEYARDSARTEEAYTARIRREQYQTTFVLSDAATARRIDSLMVTGSEPDACPEDDGEFGSSEQRGTAPEWADFAGWVETYVFGT